MRVLKVIQTEVMTFEVPDNVTAENAEDEFYFKLNDPVVEAATYEVPERHFQIWDDGKLIEEQ